MGNYADFANPDGSAQGAWTGYQSRYVAYCKAHGAATPDEMMARDEAEYPGGVMCGYILWITSKWREWGDLTGHKGPRSADDHAAFDAWLGANRPDPTVTPDLPTPQKDKDNTPG